jgi:hypothetical protein
MNLVFWLWALALVASVAFTFLRALSAREALKGLPTEHAIRALVGLRSDGLDIGRQRRVRGFRTSFLVFLLALCIPPIAIRWHLSRQFAAAASGEGVHPRKVDSEAVEILRSGRLLPVQLADSGFGIQIDRLVPGGALDRMGFRSGDTILSLNGTSFRSSYDASAGMLELTTGAPGSVAVKGSDGATRTIALRDPN